MIFIENSKDDLNIKRSCINQQNIQKISESKQQAFTIARVYRSVGSSLGLTYTTAGVSAGGWLPWNGLGFFSMPPVIIQQISCDFLS